MSEGDANRWTPFRPTADDLKAIAGDVAEITNIQPRLVDKCKALRVPDRVAHQYQIAGSKVLLRIADEVPVALKGIGLFEPGAEHRGIGRISTGLGTPHIETNPDFLGAMMAFRTRDGQRVDFLGINDPTSPTDNHRDFVSVLHATGESAGTEIPLVGDWGAYHLGNLAAEQTAFGLALSARLGLSKAAKTLAHIVRQTLRTFASSTAYQTYWTGVVEIGGNAGKFTLVPTRDENKHPGFRPGEFHLTEEWRRRQRAGDIEFLLCWIPFLSELETPLTTLTQAWQQEHKQRVGTITFPQTDSESDEARLWAILASEMGANPANYVHDEGNTIKEPATQFETAREIAYRMSQEGRGALDPQRYESVFETGRISAELAQELLRRRQEKETAGHVSWAWDPTRK